MPSISKDKIDQLTLKLRIIHNEFPTAEKRALNGALELADKLANNNFAITKNSITGQNHIFGKQSILNIFSEQFDPILNELYPEGTNGYKFRFNANILSLKKALAEKSSYELGQTLSKHIRELDKIAESANQSSDKKDVRIIGDTFYLIQDILFKINSISNNDFKTTKWCQCCFRRTHTGHKYCEIHKSSKDDTAYRQGIKTFQCLDEESIKARIYYRGIRAYLDARKLIIFSTLTKVFEDDINNPDTWLKIRAEFIEAFKSTLPNVTIALKHSLNEKAESWNSFVKSVYIGIGDEIEDSTDESNFIGYIANAELWLKQEYKYVDGRRSDIREQAINLRKQKNSRSEISKILGISRQRVNKIFQELESINAKKNGIR